MLTKLTPMHGKQIR